MIHTLTDVDVLSLLTESIAKEFEDTSNIEPVLFLSGGADSALPGMLEENISRPYRAVTIVSNPSTAEAEGVLVAGTIDLIIRRLPLIQMVQPISSPTVGIQMSQDRSDRRLLTLFYDC